MRRIRTMRRIQAVVAGIAALVCLSVLGAGPASADTEIPGSAGQFDWSGSQSFSFCYGNRVTHSDCVSSATIGEISFNVRMTLNGRQANVTTFWQVTYGEAQVQVSSMLECRHDELIDESCGFSDDVQPYQDYSTSGQFTDTFYLGNGKYFFNLQYQIDVQGSSVDPVVQDGSLDTRIGTTHRIKCSDSRAPFFCEMA